MMGRSSTQRRLHPRHFTSEFRLKRSNTSVANLRFRVVTLTDTNTMRNVDGVPPPGGEGSTISVAPSELGRDAILSPREEFTQSFFVCLSARVRFTFFGNVEGIPGL